MSEAVTSNPEVLREVGRSPSQPAARRLAHAWRLLTGFWVSREWPIAWILLLLLVAGQFVGVYFVFWQTDWERRLFNILGAHQANKVGSIIAEFCLIMVVAGGKAVLTQFLNSFINLRWRAWMTRRYVDRWMSQDCYYDIERAQRVDNPDQRITDDVNFLTGGALQIVLGFIGSTTSMITFGLLLLKLSQPIRFVLGGISFDIPGDMVVYAVIWTAVGYTAVVWAGHPLVLRTMRQQHREADFRFALGQVRRNAEQVAFARAGETEARGLGAGARRLWSAVLGAICAQVGLDAAQNVYDKVTQLLPILLLLPRYMARKLTLGSVIQSRLAFYQFYSSMSFFTQAYSSIATLTAAVNRLKALDDAIDDRTPRDIPVVHEGVGLQAVDLHLDLPDGRHLVRLGDWTVGQGERWVVRGPSGVGKSTLLRALAGLWPYGGGAVRMPGQGLIMFVPQRLYLPQGSLLDAVCFPEPAGRFSREEVATQMRRFGLERHIERLDEVGVWQDELSPGEQQRLAIARVLLHRPAYLFLDEATSALDPDNARLMYDTLLGALPGLTLISVVHAPELVIHHTHALDLSHDAQFGPLPRAA